MYHQNLLSCTLSANVRPVLDRWPFATFAFLCSDSPKKRIDDSRLAEEEDDALPIDNVQITRQNDAEARSELQCVGGVPRPTKFRHLFPKLLKRYS